MAMIVKHKEIVANIRQISAADDHQKAAEFDTGGVLSQEILKALRRGRASERDWKFRDAMRFLSDQMAARNLSQTPILSYVSDKQNPSDENFCLAPRTGVRRALIIGINYYDPEYPDLRLTGSHHDAAAMYDFIVNEEGFCKDDVTLLMDDGYHESPTSDNILEAIQDLISVSVAGDSVFFHFSGHICQMPDDDGDEIDGLDEVLVPEDIENMIPDDTLYELLHYFRKDVVVTCIVDGCHSGSIFDLPIQKRFDCGEEKKRIYTQNKRVGPQLKCLTHLMASHWNQRMKKQ